MDTSHFRRAATFVVWGVTLQLVGTLGYFWIEGWPLLDSFFMTTITLSTVGYGETRELTPVGRMFTMGLIAASIVTIACVTASITSIIVQGDISGSFLNRKAQRMAKRLKQHTIVCGSGRVATAVIDRLLSRGEPVVVIDDQESGIQRLRSKHPLLTAWLDNPADDLVLAKANLLEAKHIVVATDRDFDNLLIAMTCRDLNRSLRVFAVSHDSTVASRLAKIGVEDVICPYQLSGESVAQAIAGRHTTAV